MKTVAYFLLILLSLALPNALAARELVIDTDAGVDDVLAILFILKQPQLQVKAISIEADGATPCRSAYARIQNLIRVSGQQTISVACGRSTPLRGNHHYPSTILASGSPLTGQSKPPHNAKDLIITTLKRASQPLDILALGPLTTLAQAIDQAPGLKKKIHRIYLMGGALRVAGNVHATDPTQSNTSAEWNLYIDPYAAQKIFQSGLSITLIPLDLSNQVKLDTAFYQALKKRQNQAVAAYLYKLLYQHKKMILGGQWYFWDPLAAMIASDESLTSIEVLPLSIRLTPSALSGASRIDKKRGNPIRVCRSVKAAQLKELFLRGISS